MVLKQLTGTASGAYKKIITGLVWKFHFAFGFALDFGLYEENHKIKARLSLGASMNVEWDIKVLFWTKIAMAKAIS